MIIYGDLEFQTAFTSLVASLRVATERACDGGLEQLRSLLIQSGQLEQAIEDHYQCNSHSSNDLKQAARKITNAAAEAFCGEWTRAALGSRRASRNACVCLEKIGEQLAALRLVEDPHLTIKVPEGFAFYTLFPEQYCASTFKWATDRWAAFPKRALVVGIRSIGTALSALSAAVLKSLGWQVERLTLRPVGHPFDRRVEAPLLKLPDLNRALIVDEGPGLSGSSMAAVANWLRASRVSEIAFLTGHPGPPGNAASADVRRCWQQMPRYFTALSELRWHGKTLEETIFERFLPREKKETHDLSAGHWRPWTFKNKKDWPAVCSVFERTKFLCRNERSHPVLARFEGLDCLIGENQTPAKAALKKMHQMAVENLTAIPVGAASGFIHIPWIEGVHLRPADARNVDVLKHLGQHLHAAAEPPLAPTEAAAASARLAEMLYWNTQTLLRPGMAELTRAWAKAARDTEPTRSYGDGRVAPYEWVRTADNRLLKSNCAGHQRDHTIIGKQSLLWDIAGIVVDWNLEPSQVEFLLTSTHLRTMKANPLELGFFCLAYAAFRAGIMVLAGSQLPANPLERTRVARALTYYKSKLLEVLSRPPPGLSRKPKPQASQSRNARITQNRKTGRPLRFSPRT